MESDRSQCLRVTRIENNALVSTKQARWSRYIRSTSGFGRSSRMEERGIEEKEGEREAIHHSMEPRLCKRTATASRPCHKNTSTPISRPPKGQPPQPQLTWRISSSRYVDARRCEATHKQWLWDDLGGHLLHRSPQASRLLPSSCSPSLGDGQSPLSKTWFSEKRPRARIWRAQA